MRIWLKTKSLIETKKNQRLIQSEIEKSLRNCYKGKKKSGRGGRHDLEQPNVNDQYFGTSNFRILKEQKMDYFWFLFYIF